MTVALGDQVIQLASGKYVSLMDPQPEDIRLSDITWSLSHLCRFTGHSASFYSVAQHSVLVSRLVPAAFAASGLLHDAAEAYVGDVSSPVKWYLEAHAPGVFHDLEHRFLRVIAERYDLPYPEPPVVKDADLVALATEKRDLMDGDAWLGLPEPSGTLIMPQRCEHAGYAFKRRAKEVGLEWT